jgi:hypothetical protein
MRAFFSSESIKNALALIGPALNIFSKQKCMISQVGHFFTVGFVFREFFTYELKE